MSGIKEVIENYAEIVQLFKEKGVEDVVFFKGFSKKEEHNLNIVLKSCENPPHRDSLRTRKLYINDQLLKLLKCKIIIDTYDSMLPDYQAKLNASNSVKITPELSEEAFSSAFGLDWQFNPAADFELSQVKLKDLPFYFNKSQSSASESKQVLKQTDSLNELEEKTASYFVDNLITSLPTPVTKSELDRIFQRIAEKTELKLNKIVEQKTPKTNIQS